MNMLFNYLPRCIRILSILLQTYTQGVFYVNDQTFLEFAQFHQLRRLSTLIDCFLLTLLFSLCILFGRNPPIWTYPLFIKTVDFLTKENRDFLASSSSYITVLFSFQKRNRNNLLMYFYSNHFVLFNQLCQYLCWGKKDASKRKFLLRNKNPPFHSSI